MRRGAWTAGLAVVVAVLAGCSEPGQPSTTLPTATSTSAAAPTLEPLGPADFPVPAEAREQTEAGAEAFVRYYVDLINRAQADLDSQYLTEFSSSCDTCDTLASGFASYAQAGYSIEGGRISIGSFNPPSVTGGEAQFVLSLSQDSVTVTDRSGAVQSDLSAGSAVFPGSGGIARWVPTTSSWQLEQLTIA